MISSHIASSSAKIAAPLKGRSRYEPSGPGGPEPSEGSCGHLFPASSAAAHCLQHLRSFFVVGASEFVWRRRPYSSAFLSTVAHVPPGAERLRCRPIRFVERGRGRTDTATSGCWMDSLVPPGRAQRGPGQQPRENQGEAENSFQAQSCNRLSYPGPRDLHGLGGRPARREQRRQHVARVASAAVPPSPWPTGNPGPRSRQFRRDFGSNQRQPMR